MSHRSDGALSMATPSEPASIYAMHKSHYENFHIGSFLFPRRLRRPLWTIYAYCRTVDDIGDEAPGDRLALLDQFEDDLKKCFGGAPSLPLLQTLQHVIREFDMPSEPFFRLIEANRRDQTIHRYTSFDQLTDYCTYSANPVGHMVLALLRQNSPKNLRLSDATCTALQLTNFWQDVSVDRKKGRVYIPLDDMSAVGYDLRMLSQNIVNDSWKKLMRLQIQRTRSLFAEGEGLLNNIPGRLRMEIALFSMGGQRILDLIEARDYNVLTERPTISKAARVALFWRALLTYPPNRRIRS